MTQAFNLAQLANNLNTSGQLDATDGLNGLVANANLASSGTASSSTYLRGDRTWATVTQKILQVVSVTKTDGFSSSSTTPVDITGMSASITPSATSSKILILANLSYSSSNYTNGGFPNLYFTMNDGSGNVIVQGDTQGVRKRGVINGMFFYSSGQLNNAPINYLWSPNTTSAVTVKLRGAISAGSFTVNYTYNEDNQGGYGNFSGVSTITLMEIGA